MRACRMLSSATDATTQSSLGFQAKSEILLVWPPWMNSSSGGPSSASSGDCAQTKHAGLGRCYHDYGRWCHAPH